jgi:glycosyltransferase involved in cell wall biosynthesis
LRFRQRETISDVSVVRVPLYPDHSQSALRRGLNYLSFALSAALLGPGGVDRPDVIFAYHPPLTIGVPAWVLSRLWRVPFVYQIQDMWPETLTATGMLNNGRILDLIDRFAKWVYSRSDAICVISPGFRDNLIEKGVSPGKIYTIPNWVDAETYYPDVPDLKLAKDLGLAGKFNVMFAGNIGEAQGLHTALDAAKALEDLPQVQFVMIGDGVALSRLRHEAEVRGLSNVRFLGRYPVESMPSLYALADVLLVHLKDNPLFRITIPHKIFAYMASGKPILAAVAGNAADVGSDADAGVTCSPEDPEAMAAAVRQFASMPMQERQRMGEQGLAVVHQEYSRETLVSQIEQLLCFVANEQRPG